MQNDQENESSRGMFAYSHNSPSCGTCYDTENGWLTCGGDAEDRRTCLLEIHNVSVNVRVFRIVGSFDFVVQVTLLEDCNTIPSTRLLSFIQGIIQGIVVCARTDITVTAPFWNNIAQYNADKTPQFHCWALFHNYWILFITLVHLLWKLNQLTIFWWMVSHFG